MKFSKLLLPLIVALGLSACATPNDTITVSSTSQTQDPAEIFDYEFNGIEMASTPIMSDDYNFSGILDNFDFERWLLVGDTYEFDIKPKQGGLKTYNVEVENPDVIKYEKAFKNGKMTHTLKGLKTGGSVLKIYTGDELIYRNVVNARVPFDSVKTLFDKIGEPDYWRGVFTELGAAGEYRLMLSQGEDGYNTRAVLSMNEIEHDYGTVTFDIIIPENGQPEILTLRQLKFYNFAVQIVIGAEVNPISIQIALTGTAIYVQDKEIMTDVFRPIYSK